MPAQLECYVYVVLPGSTEFVTAGRFSQSRDRQGQPVGTFVYGRRYRERPDAKEKRFYKTMIPKADALYDEHLINLQSHPKP